MSERVIALLRNIQLEQLGQTEGWVFPSKKSTSGHIGLRGIEHAFRKLARKLGIPDALKLYCARHTFGTVAMAETRNDWSAGLTGDELSAYPSAASPEDGNVQAGDSKFDSAIVHAKLMLIIVAIWFALNPTYSSALVQLSGINLSTHMFSMFTVFDNELHSSNEYSRVRFIARPALGFFEGYDLLSFRPFACRIEKFIKQVFLLSYDRVIHLVGQFGIVGHRIAEAHPASLNYWLDIGLCDFGLSRWSNACEYTSHKNVSGNQFGLFFGPNIRLDSGHHESPPVFGHILSGARLPRNGSESFLA